MSATDRLSEILTPAHTAVLTMEMQQGIVGDEALFPALAAQVAEVQLVDRVSVLCAGAREAGVRVVHNTMVARPDGAGGAVNCKVLAMERKAAAARGQSPTEMGTSGAEVLPELRGGESDIEVARQHGMTPFTSTSLDQVLRNIGVRTVVVSGVSLNVGVLGMVLSAVDLGYQVVVPRDAVTGVPADYADAVIDNSLAMLATVTTIDEVIAAWR